MGPHASAAAAGRRRASARCSRCCSSCSWPGRCCGPTELDAPVGGARRRRGRQLGARARARALHRLHVRVRGDVDPDSRGDGRRRRAGAAGGRPVIPLEPLPDRLGDPVRDRHGRRVPAPQPDHDPAVDRDHAERREPDVRRVRPLRSASVDGQIITFFVMTVAAAEAAVGLAHRHRALPPPRVAQPRRLHVAEVVSRARPDSRCFRSSASSSTRRSAGACRRRSRAASRRWRCSPSFAVSVDQSCGSSRRSPPTQRAHRADALHLDRVGRLRARPDVPRSIRCRR